MGKNKKRFNKSVELFNEKSGEIVRVIQFKKSRDFDHFLYAFKSMRYPGYNWKYRKENKNNAGRKRKIK